MSEDLVIKLCDERAALQEQLEKTQAELERRTAWSNAEIAERDQAIVEIAGEVARQQAEVARLRAKYDKDLSDAEIAHQAEVARLREELGERASMGSLQDMFSRLNDAEHNLAAERAAHEATERSRQEATDRALGIAAKLDETVRALEATKAELAKEQRLTRFTQTQSRDELLSRAEAAEARVAELERVVWEWVEANKLLGASARNLLERALLSLEPGSVMLRTDLEDWLRAHPATPAATGRASRCDYEGCEQIDEGNGYCFHGEWVKKEQGT